MARTTTPTITLPADLPKTLGKVENFDPKILDKDSGLPKGCEIVEAERTVDGNKIIVGSLAPISGNAEGVRNFITVVSALAEGMKVEKGKEDRRWNGVDFVSAAIRSAVLSGQDSADERIIPAPSEPRTVDKSAVLAAKIQEKIAKGEPVNEKVLAELYASVGMSYGG